MKRYLYILLIVVCVILAGCGKKKDSDRTETSAAGTGTDTSQDLPIPQAASNEKEELSDQKETEAVVPAVVHYENYENWYDCYRSDEFPVLTHEEARNSYGTKNICYECPESDGHFTRDYSIVLADEWAYITARGTSWGVIDPYGKDQRSVMFYAGREDFLNCKSVTDAIENEVVLPLLISCDTENRPYIYTATGNGAKEFQNYLWHWMFADGKLYFDLSIEHTNETLRASMNGESYTLPKEISHEESVRESYICEVRGNDLYPLLDIDRYIEDFTYTPYGFLYLTSEKVPDTDRYHYQIHKLTEDGDEEAIVDFEVRGDVEWVTNGEVIVYYCLVPDEIYFYNLASGTTSGPFDYSGDFNNFLFINSRYVFCRGDKSIVKINLDDGEMTNLLSSKEFPEECERLNGRAGTLSKWGDDSLQTIELYFNMPSVPNETTKYMYYQFDLSDGTLTESEDQYDHKWY